MPYASQGRCLRRPRRLAGIVLAALLLAGGCLHRTPTSPGASAPGPGFTTLEHALLGGFLTVEVSIPTLPEGPRPAVISPFVPQERLLEVGLAVVRYTAHWEMLRGLRPRTEPEPARVGAWLLAAPRPGIVGRAYFEFIAANARSHLPLVMDYLETLPEIDARRIGVSGSSTAGFTALEALVVEPRLAAGVVRVACGDYHEFLEKSSLALAGDERWLVEGELVLDEDYEAALRAREPIRFAERFPPRPLLMLNGSEDPAIPVACARRTAQALEPEYAARGLSERFRHVLYQGQGHNLGEPARVEALRWWQRWLLESAPGDTHPVAPGC